MGLFLGFSLHVRFCPSTLKGYRLVFPHCLCSLPWFQCFQSIPLQFSPNDCFFFLSSSYSAGMGQNSLPLTRIRFQDWLLENSFSQRQVFTGEKSLEQFPFSSPPRPWGALSQPNHEHQPGIPGGQTQSVWEPCCDSSNVSLSPARLPCTSRHSSQLLSKCFYWCRVCSTFCSR